MQRWVTVVGYVCLSVTLHLASPMSIHVKNDTAYLTGNEGQKFCGDFSENYLLLRCGVICVSQQCVWPYFMFMATVASLLVRKANEILKIDLFTNQCVKKAASQQHITCNEWLRMHS